MIPAADKWQRVSLDYAGHRCIPRRNARSVILTGPQDKPVREVDPETLQIREGALFIGSNAVEAEDGTFVHISRQQNSSQIITSDLLRGQAEAQAVTHPDHMMYRLKNYGFCAVSPNGKYCLRPDVRALVSRKKPGLKALFGAEREYALRIELWEARPLRFVRTLNLAWLTWQEMPDEQSHRKPNDHRKSLYAAIADISAKTSRDDSHFPDKKNYEAIHRGDDNEWDYILDNWLELATRWPKNFSWTSDSQSFWCTINGFVVQTHIDGRHSPRIGLERFGYSQDAWLPATPYPNSIEPLNASDIRLVYNLKGEAIVKSTLSNNPANVAFIADDRWVPHDREIYETVQRLKIASNEKSRSLEIELQGLDETSVRKAIQDLSVCIPKRIQKHAIDGRIDIRFMLPGKVMSEAAFFTHVRANVPQAIDDVERLLEKQVDHQQESSMDIWSDDQDTVLFGHAASLYAALHPSPFRLLQRFCKILDYEHTSFARRSLIPTLAQRFHGTSELLDFAVWYIGDDVFYSHTGYEVLHALNLPQTDPGRYSPKHFAELLVDRLAALHPDAMAEDPDYAAETIRSIVRAFEHSKVQEPPWLLALAAELKSIVSRNQ